MTSEPPRPVSAVTSEATAPTATAWCALIQATVAALADGAAAADPRASLATVLWISVHHAVAAGVLLSLAGAIAGHDLAAGSAIVWVLGWLLTSWQLRRLQHRAGTFRWWTWALFPVPLLAFDLVFARSALLTVVRRSVRWRGRTVDLRDDARAREVG